MDEPTAGQDYRNYMGFMDSILQMPNFSAILFITHDLDLAVSYAPRCLDGRWTHRGRRQYIEGAVHSRTAERLSPLLDIPSADQPGDVRK